MNFPRSITGNCVATVEPGRTTCNCLNFHALGGRVAGQTSCAPVVFARHPDGAFCRYGESSSLRIRANTLAYIAAVTLPVCVFCWLG